MFILYIYCIPYINLLIIDLLDRLLHRACDLANLSVKVDVAFALSNLLKLTVLLQLSSTNSNN